MTSLLATHHFASAGSGIGRALKNSGAPEWLLWVFLGLWICIYVARRFLRD